MTIINRDSKYQYAFQLLSTISSSRILSSRMPISAQRSSETVVHNDKPQAYKLLAISLFIETVGLERTSDQKPNAQYLTAHPPFVWHRHRLIHDHIAETDIATRKECTEWPTIRFATREFVILAASFSIVSWRCFL